MKLNKKTISIALLSLSACVIIFALGYKATIRNNKLKEIDYLFTEFIDDSSKLGDVVAKLSKYKKDEDKTVVNKAIETYNKVVETSYERAVLDEVNKYMGDLTDITRKNYLEQLKEFKADSIYYDEAQELIAKLNYIEENKTKIVITYYSKSYSAGLKELTIKLKNTSGKDIKYLALDIFEVDKDGSVINSDWTNTDALILNDASATIDTYFRYQSSVSDLKFEIREVMYK